MSAGSTLLELQDLDLRIARQKADIAAMPEIRALAEKKKVHAKLKAEVNKLFAERKDLDTELADLKFEKEDTEEDVTLAQRASIDSSDYRAVQDLERKLSDLAKKLDRIEHRMKDALPEQAKAQEAEDRARKALAQYEEGIIADTRAAREKAAAMQKAINHDAEERERLAAQLSEDVLARYAASIKANRGIAVETLQGNIPSVCHMALQTSSMDDLRHAGDIAECPYCHRILVMPQEEE